MIEISNKEDYVSFEVAKLLKEKGFDKPCNGWYGRNGTMFYDIYRENHNSSFPDDARMSMPTLYEAQKWLREKHNIHLVTQCITYHGPTHHFDYKCEVFSFNRNRGYRVANIRHTYEETLNLGILEALKLI